MRLLTSPRGVIDQSVIVNQKDFFSPPLVHSPLDTELLDFRSVPKKSSKIQNAPWEHNPRQSPRQYHVQMPDPLHLVLKRLNWNSLQQSAL